jgi:conjugative transfer signal peptidase TraF
MTRTFVACAAAGIAVALTAHGAGVVINATPSMARGVWQRTDQPLARGVVVIACPPRTTTLELGADRHYLGDGDCPSRHEPLIKPIAAMPGDTVVVRRSGTIEVNGTPLNNSRSLRNDEGGRPLTGMPAGTYAVAAGHVWLISTYSPLSFDSRYLGPVPISSIRGTVKPLWTIE